MSDTEMNGRELEWITSRWVFEMSDADRTHLAARAADDEKREELVSGIIAGSAAMMPQHGWLQPALPLRGYQRIAADLAKASGALLIGDELGGGKTAMSLAVLEDPDARPPLAVILTGLGGQWLRELDKFYPQLRGIELRTTKADVEFDKLCGPDGRIAYDLILVNYAKLAAWQHHLAGRVRSVIFDEVQELRRPGPSSTRQPPTSRRRRKRRSACRRPRCTTTAAKSSPSWTHWPRAASGTEPSSCASGAAAPTFTARPPTPCPRSTSTTTPKRCAHTWRPAASTSAAPSTRWASTFPAPSPSSRSSPRTPRSTRN
ncbi:MAG: hypothetical protein U5N53_28410 [Mycobacterium sp.]|nr:hypothetical protein [Mycobacterium sp.]